MKRALGRVAAMGVSFAFAGGVAWAASEDNPKAAALRQMRLELPDARMRYAADQLTRIYGQPLSYGESPEDSAAQFQIAHAEVFGVQPSDLKPRSLLADRRATQPVKLNRQTGEYEFTLIYYTQYYSEIEVFRSDLRLLVRNEPGYPLVLAASALRDLGDFAIPADLRSNVDEKAFVESTLALAQENVLAAKPSLKNFTAPSTVIWAGVDDMRVEPKVALVFVADDAPLADGIPNEKWLFVADAETGDILFEEDQVLQVDVSGNVSGLSTQGSASEQCGAEVAEAMPYARVVIGTTTAFADVNGNFTIANPGSSSVAVTSGVRGQYFRATDQSTGDTVITTNVTPPGPVNFVHNAANTDERRRAEVNVYIHANRIRDMVLDTNPSYPVIGGQTEFSLSVNEVGGICPGNAQYVGTALRFCLSGGGSPNTGWNSVVYHEYGHHLVEVGGSGQGAYGEGMGDICSILMLDESGLGFGFFGACATPLRNADNTCDYSAGSCSTCGSAIHTCGQLISGCVWETRNELVITNPSDYLDIIRDLALNSILLHSGSSITPDITIDFLTLDDNDSNIGNGTPHFQAICNGFGEHAMPCPALDPIGFEYPGGLPANVPPNQPASIAVNATSVTTTPIPGTGTVSYRIGSSGPFTTVPMTQGAPNAYTASLPGASCPQTIEFYFSVQATGVGIVTDPENAPTNVYRTVAATGTNVAVDYNFQTNPGWAVASTASDGPWDTNPGVPVAGCNRGNPQTDFDGSGQCWMTDNSAAAACNSDVDNGSTTLTSQVLDLSAVDSPRVTYARWFSNNTGDGPETDRLIVEISVNGGTTWTNLETVGPTSTSPNPEIDGGWFQKTYPIPNSAQFRIRFIAEDAGTQSVVEAAIDAFKVFGFECGPALVPGDMNCDGVISVGDISGFVLALTNPAGYAAAFPGCNINNADVNGDSAISVGDISAFVALLTG